ncbi:hypothetical protein SSIL_1601 [Solibacillus silvestris StLB046]|uniref:Uncharacterized protein n=1 Tax=Solibacillus silvestris (strain StLB046) TaxID=1002809 RepID=F2F7T1_SOLSS|nr:hypothetical protein SSIL_1601 [Solibacillus silvestris StLB046]
MNGYSLNGIQYYCDKTIKMFKKWSLRNGHTTIGIPGFEFT